ncbi:MAG: flagellar basal body L-ring protein FlgH [Deltaproteobacteria bacterium]|nr:flagellar basal body L-ring protein FlgH [Deltaproteobacteria bacterium]
MYPLLFALLALAQEPPVRPAPLQEPVAAEPASPGSLWAEVPARQLMGLDGSARQLGDLITVRITERTATALDAETRANSDSSTSAGIAALLGAEKNLTGAFPNMGGEIALQGTREGTFQGAGQTTRGASVDASLTCEVIEVFPNGNLRIWGYKQVRVNREVQYVVLEGVVRPRDIQMDNTVDSELLARAKIEVTGSGVIDDKQSPGFLARVADKVWPF